MRAPSSEQKRTLLDGIGALGDRLESFDGQKTIVLVSEGIYFDQCLRADFERFASRAQAAQTRI